MKRRRRCFFEVLENRLCLTAPTPYPGSPFSLAQVGPATESAFQAAPLFANLRGDGKQEIIIPLAGGKLAAYETNANGQFALDANRNPIPFMTYDTGSSANTHANIKSTPIAIFDPFIGHMAVFAALGRDESNPGAIEDGRLFGWDALTGAILPGWPQDTGHSFQNANQAGATGPLASGDLDGDGVPEIVVTSFSTFVSAYHMNGSLQWRYDNDETVESGAAIGDLYHDGKNEVVLATGISPSIFYPAGGQMTILNGSTGTVMYRTGAMSSDPAQRIPEVFFSTPILADLNGDGKLEIIDGAGPHFNDPAIAGFSPAAQAAGNRVYAWDGQGNLLPGWPYHTTSVDTQNHQAFVSDAAADLFGNGQMEVVHVDLLGILHVILPNGQAAPGWAGGKQVYAPGFIVTLATEAFGAPIVADVDGNGKPDIVVADAAFLAAFDANGNLLWRVTTPVTAGANIPESVLGAAGAIGSLNGTGDLELASLSFAALVPNRPSSLSVFSLPATSLAPPWPMLRRSAAGVAVQNSLVFDAGLTRQMYSALLGRGPTNAELVAAAFGLQQNQFTATNLASFLDTSNEARGHVVDLLYSRYLGHPAPAQDRAAFAYALSFARQRDVAQALMNMSEFTRGLTSLSALIQKLYQSTLGRQPSAQELQASLNQFQGGVGYGNFTSALLNSGEAIARDAAPFYAAVTGSGAIPPDSFAALALDLQRGAREETVNAKVLATGGQYAASNYLAAWIRSAYRDTLDRNASPAEVAGVFNVLANGTISMTNLVTYLLTSAEGRAAFLQQQFQRYLGRAASPGDISVFLNYARREDVEIVLISSPEYFIRAGGNNAAYVQAVYRDVIKFATIDSGTLNFWLSQLNAGASRSVVAKAVLDAQIPADDYFRYLPDQSLGVLPMGPLPPTAPGQPINPDPAKVSAFRAALQAGASEESLIAGLMTTAQYILRSSYNKGIFRNRAIWN
jgi:hypothetical protein